jgi:hypothetical protein
VLRASAAAEQAGIPTVSICCEGFVGQARSTCIGLGYPDLGIAVVPGHPDVQTAEQLRASVIERTAAEVIQALTRTASIVTTVQEPDTHEVVCHGDFEQVNEYFLAREWSDGLPVVPPTREKVGEFLAFTDLPEDHTFGILLPDSRAATVWSVAVNGVMAGCRPEYMPILCAVVEALADSQFGVQHNGNTPGSETLIAINGPIAKELKFNWLQGALRDGFQANTSIGRFFRLYLRNIAGFLPHRTDKATFGSTWHVAFAENEAFLQESGWLPLSAEGGCKSGENAVTISRFTGHKPIVCVYGDTPDKILPYLADSMVCATTWECTMTFGLFNDAYRPLLILSPLIASVFSRARYSKDDIKKRLFELARIPAWKFDKYIRGWTNLYSGHRSLYEAARLGLAPSVFGESDNPERLVPIVGVWRNFHIAVGGDPDRSNCIVFTQNGPLGFPTTKRISLPRSWESRQQS